MCKVETRIEGKEKLEPGGGEKRQLALKNKLQCIWTNIT